MTHEVIERYLNEILKPNFDTYGTPAVFTERILATVRELMSSCVSHWNDVPFRKAILVVGEEEGSYYLPKARADIRNFVVVTLRNSALESIHSDSYNPTGQGRLLWP
jgi:hypothetical protein